MSQFFDDRQKISKTRHNLTHWQQDQTWIFVTWRLADSIPKSILLDWKRKEETFLKLHPKPWDNETAATYHRRFTMALETHLDQAHGSCLLTDHHQIVADAFHHFDGIRYDLDTFVVMPNHVHLLFHPFKDHTLPNIIQSLKSFTARKINKSLNQSGTLWQPDYWDRLIRSQKHFDWTRKYIQQNPIKLKPSTYALYQK